MELAKALRSCGNCHQGRGNCQQPYAGLSQISYKAARPERCGTGPGGMRKSKLWAAVRSKPLQEAYAVRHLRNQKVACYLPLVFNDRCRRREPLFPNYFFVQIERDGSWAFINHTHGVRYVIAIQGRPCVVPNGAIKVMQQAENQNGLIVLPEQQEFETDDTLRITAGPFTGHDAKFLRYPAPKRVELLLTFLGSQHRVTVPRTSVSAHRAV